MLLPIKKSYQLLANYGCLARDIYDKCGIVLGAVRFTRHGESEVYCARECRGDAQRSETYRRGGKIKKILREDFLSRGPLSKWGEFTLISPVGLVKPFLMLMRGKGLEAFPGAKGDGCVKDTRNHPRDR